jgi:putative ABC transport system permease protein
MPSVLADFTGDVHFALRLLRRQKVFAVASVLTLALGIGATTTMFAVVDATMLRPLPYRDADRLVSVGVFAKDPDGVETPFGPSQMELIRWQGAKGAFDAIEAVEPRIVALTGSGEPEAAKAAAVSSGLFGMLGVPPIAGRTFTADEERTDAAVAVVSEELARRRFGGASAVGRVLTIDGRSFDVVGVMPARYRPLLIASDLWVPLHATADLRNLATRVMAGAGRLKPGISAAQAAGELAPASAALGREFPASYSRVRPRVVPLRDQLYGSQKLATIALAGAVLVLLALASVNVLNLTLGHLAGRRREIAVRVMIGGSCWRLARLQAVETGVLACLGCALGLVVMRWLLPPLLAMYAASGQTPIEAALDWRIAGFAALVTLATTITSGIVPALRAHSAAAGGRLEQASTTRVGAGPWERRLRAGLVVAQMALAVTLLCAAAAFIVSLQRVLSVSPGFAADHILTAQLRIAPARYTDTPSRAHFVQRIVDRIAAIPGVQAVGTTQTTFLPNQSMMSSVWLDGQPIDAEHEQTVHIRHATPGYFEALRVGIVEGRALDRRDQLDSPFVCVVSARFAKAYWGGQRAVGHRVRRGGATAKWMTVVGVAADVMDAGLGVAQGPTLYVPYLQQNTATARVTLVVRTDGNPMAMAKQVERAVWSEDPLQPVDATARLDDVLAEGTGDRRFQTIVLATFAAAGLALALVGVYGVTAAAARARTWEVGVRMALGATPRLVVLDLVFEAASRIGAGVAVGVVLFLASGRAAASLLYDTSFGDARILAAAIVPLAAAALAISYAQARRLAGVQPVSALRNDSM